MGSFYSQTLQKAQIPKDARVLVVCGGAFDREVLLANGFTSVTISNLDERVRGGMSLPPFRGAFRMQSSSRLKTKRLIMYSCMPVCTIALLRIVLCLRCIGLLAGVSSRLKRETAY
jgi:hypothetical protein